MAIDLTNIVQNSERFKRTGNYDINRLIRDLQDFEREFIALAEAIQTGIIKGEKGDPGKDGVNGTDGVTTIINKEVPVSLDLSQYVPYADTIPVAAAQQGWIISAGVGDFTYKLFQLIYSLKSSTYRTWDLGIIDHDLGSVSVAATETLDLGSI